MGSCPVLDVRSPSEYNHAHIPEARSLPLFTDEERVVVGTTYKQKGRQEAIKIGLECFGPKMRTMVDEVDAKCKSQNAKILIHCWRGGMRSAAIAWLMDLYGYKVYVLKGGYKAFRNWTLKQFEREYNFQVVGGYTGTGKTMVLHELKSRGKTILDLEGIALHKGSAFGGLDKFTQPSNEMLENMIAYNLYQVTKDQPNQPIWVEDESQRIGNLNVPTFLWAQLRRRPLYFLNVPFEGRLSYLVIEYGKYPKKGLIEAIERIQKRLGNLNAKNAIAFLEDGDIRSGFKILLEYYDKSYHKALLNRPTLSGILIDIPCNKVSAFENTDKVLEVYLHQVKTGV